MLHRSGTKAVLAATAGLAIVGLLLAMGPQLRTVSAADNDADVRAAATSAINMDNAAYVLPSGKLPSGIAVGHAAAADRTQLRDQVTASLKSYGTGKFLSLRLNQRLAWADGINSGSIFDTFKNVQSVNISSVVRQGTAATVTGTYAIYVQHGQVVDTQGHVTTWGGRGVESFITSFVLTSGHWLISDQTLTETAYTPDPSLDSGFEYIPAQSKPSVAPGAAGALPIVP
jgi:hypothetical protein